MNRNPFSLEGRTILVTGASSGIGRAVAVEASNLGATLILLGRNVAKLEETLSFLSGPGHTVHSFDLNDLERHESVVRALALLQGAVFCAGKIEVVPFRLTTLEKIDSLMSTNFTAQALFCQKLLNLKKIDKAASLVWISSVSGYTVSGPGLSIYSATKGAVNGFVKGLALELAPRRIRVNSVSPAMVETELIKGGVFSSEQKRSDLEHYPLGRYGQPNDIAYASVYLLSDAASWVTGTNLLVDGGVSLV